jgi:hypothetical protein
VLAEEMQIEILHFALLSKPFRVFFVGYLATASVAGVA